jgi:hypothetical protein
MRVFDPKELVKQAKAIRVLVDEDLGVIRYTLLTYDELNEIMEKVQDNRERSMHLLWKQLEPANKGLTVEDVRKLPYEVVVRLLMKLQTEGSFFPRRKTLPSGSEKTVEPKE